MWKTKSRNAGRPGSGLPQYGEITCWYKEDDLCDSIEEFCRHDPERLKLVINFAPVAVSNDEEATGAEWFSKTEKTA